MVTRCVGGASHERESIIMLLDNLTPDEVTALELATGVPIVYELDAAGKSIAGADGKPFGKKILNDWLCIISFRSIVMMLILTTMLC